METALHHKVFGEGVVLSVDAGVAPPTLDVLFLSGEKKLKADPVYWNDTPESLLGLVRRFSNPLARVAERLGIDCDGKTLKDIGVAIAHHDHEVIEYNQTLATQYADGILFTEEDLLFRCLDCPNAFCPENGYNEFVCESCGREYSLEDFSPDLALDEDGNEEGRPSEEENEDL